MDRDKRWERVEKAYDAVALGEGPQEPDAQTCLEHSYAADISDEFVIPTVIHKHPVQDGDSIVFFNFRPDRARQLTTAFVVPDFDGFPRPKKLDTYFATMTRYEDDLPVHVVYDKERIPDTLGEVLSKAARRSCALPKRKNTLTSRISSMAAKKNRIPVKTASSYRRRKLRRMTCSRK